MITVEEATAIIFGQVRDFGIQEVCLEESLGRVLKENLFADRDFPPYTRVTMDGIAIQYEAFASGQRIFPIEGIQAAGAPKQKLQNKAHCLEVMTGAVLPGDTDTVIRYEDVEIKDGVARIMVEEIKEKQNAHPQGFNRKTGDQIITAGCRISPAEIGVAATLGKTKLNVAALPKTVVIYTGDELVAVGETPLPHQIRVSNYYSISAALAKWGIHAEKLHLLDEQQEIKEKLEKVLREYDLVILSGGVSKGKFDFIPSILEELGVEKQFHWVKERPGKPFWFGTFKEKSVVFALPGNPVSSFVGSLRYVIPWVRKSLNQEPFDEFFAKLGADFEFKPDLTYFLQVKTQVDTSGVIWALPVMGKGSGDLANLADADGFLELPSGKDLFKKGDAYRLIGYR